MKKLLILKINLIRNMTLKIDNSIFIKPFLLPLFRNEYKNNLKINIKK